MEENVQITVQHRAVEYNKPGCRTNKASQARCICDPMASHNYVDAMDHTFTLQHHRLMQKKTATVSQV